jgi:hypothetical protein
VLLKVVIVVLLIGVVASLFSGLVFLFKDSERPDSRRTLYALGVRITLAAALLLTVFYGLYTGQLRMGSNAPWHDRTRDPGPQSPVDPVAPDETPGPARSGPDAPQPR